MPAPAEKEVTIQETFEALSALRKEVELVSPSQERLESINKILDTQDEQNQKLFKAQEESAKREKAFEAQLHDLELEIARGGSESKDIKRQDTLAYKTLESWIKRGEMGLRELDEKDLKTLRSDNQTSGGYLVTSEMDSQITKEITEFSAIRTLARVRTIASKSLEMPIRNSIPVATFEGEAAAGGDSESSYRNETVTPYRQTFTTPVTKDQLMDSAFDMESEIMTDSAEAFGKGEGAGFVSGDGNKQPEGFLVHPDVIAGALDGNGGSGLITADDVILLTGQLKTGYDPTYILNRAVLAYLRTLKATTGQYLWLPGLNGPVSNTLSGFPYLIAQDMPPMAADSLSIAFGDFRRGYTIIDRAGLSVVRDEVTKKRQAIVEFTMHRWLTGQVTLPEAITVLKTPA